MIYKYIRFSTEKQDDRSQETIIDEYLTRKGMTADKTFKDEGISGGRAYTQRNLFNLCLSLQRHDTVVVSEVSRLTRSGIGELCEIIERYFKPNGLRLIICREGFDIDCSDINPLVEMQLYMCATFAKIEKSLIQGRTKDKLEAIKTEIDSNGFYVTKSGRVITKLGNGRKPTRECVKAASAKRMEKADSNEANKVFEAYLGIFESHHEPPQWGDTMAWYQDLADELNKMGCKTPSGEEYTAMRAYDMHRFLKRRLKRRNQIGKEEKL